jgi:hypothetical protein
LSLKSPIAYRQSQLPLHGLVQHAASEDEAEAAVKDFQEAAPGPEQHLARLGQEGASELTTRLFGTDAAHQRQVVLPQFVHVVGIEDRMKLWMKLVSVCSVESLGLGGEVQLQ